MIKDITKYTTFGISATCKDILHMYFESDVEAIYKNNNKTNYKILGGGSNVLITKNIDDVVLVNRIKGLNVINESDTDIIVEVGGGENWHNLVMWSVSHGLGGIENMALIPGTVGAAPIQNIGAYGIEQKDAFVRLKAYQIDSGEWKTFEKEECEFGYRDSIFKRHAKDQFFITKVTYRLHKNSIINNSYKDVSQYLDLHKVTNPGVKDIANAVIAIRTSKLPDPAIIGNAGSFYKNPIVPISSLNTLIASYPAIPHYPAESGHIKLAAGWLIDQCGYKGKQVGNTGTYKNQALVLVNHGGATGTEIWNFAQEIQEAVFSKFGVNIEAEVNIW